MTHINRKIIITIDGEKGHSGKTTVEITENGKPKNRFEWTEATYTSLILMEIATDILCACHEDMMKHWMKYNHVPDAGKMVEPDHIADASKMEQPEVDEDEKMRMLFDCLGSDCTLNRKLLEANGCSIEEMLAFIEKEREEAEKRHERIEQRWKEVQEIDRSMRELRKNLFGEEKEQKPIVLSDKFEITLEKFLMNARDVSEKTFAEDVREYADRLREIVINEKKPAEWSEEEKRKLNRIYQILGWAADTHAYSTTCRLIGDKEAIELQDFLRSIAKPGDRPAEWSEEDEKMRRRAICACNFTIDRTFSETHYGEARDWLKSLPERLSIPPKQEWSEEDEQTINVAIETLESEHYVILAKRLKSLRSRPKSSDNLPKWKKASAGTKLPSESVIRAEGQDPRFGSVAVYDCEYITIKELGKLPKED